MTKNEIRELLTQTICNIKFEKTDGTIRNMQCTLMSSFLPDLDPKETLLPRPRRDENPNILAVFDTEKGDWRSFRVSSVLEIYALYPKENEGVKYAASTQE